MRENVQKLRRNQLLEGDFRQDKSKKILRKQGMTLKYAILFVCLVLLAGCGAAGQSVTSTPTPTLSPATSSTKITWMINAAALDSLQTTAGWSQADNARYFDNANTYVLGTMPDGWQSMNTRTFTSYTALKAAFDAGTISSSVQAIVYDNEAWQFTPLSEQTNFASSVQETATLVHNHNMKLIATPATDLVSVLDPNGTGTVYSRYLSLNIVKAAAQYADVVEIQAQGSEASLTTYKQFVREAATQAKTANPNAVVLAGLSTNPSGQKVTGQQLYAAYQATKSFVSGYWLNIPGNQGGYCPRCGTPQPQVAIDFLRMLG